MDYQIVEKPAFRVIGREKRIGMANGENKRLIPLFWQESSRDGTVGRLAQLSAGGTVFPDATLGICADVAADHSDFTYAIAADAGPVAAPEGMTAREIPPLTWAVFESHGALPTAIQAVWDRIWSEFFATEAFAHGPGPELEVYPEGNPMGEDYRCEVWIPVLRK